MQTVLRHRLPPSIEAPGQARAALRELPSRLQPQVPALELLVSELVANSVRHGSLLPSDQIVLVVEDLGDSVRVEVGDPGRCYKEAQAGWSRAHDDPDGAASKGAYGLVIVNSAADRSGVRWEDGTVAWFEIPSEPNA
jgi:anti-sigma regulatory factor (Ser/Thr protein kinase)